MGTVLDMDRLARLVQVQRGTWSLREASRACGVSAPTLSRVEHGQVPDIATFLALCDWLELPPWAFFRAAQTPSPVDPVEAVVQGLQADPQLEPAVAQVLATVIRAAVRALRVSPPAGPASPGEG